MKQLSDEFGDDLAVIAFPTGEFGGQELPTDEAIAKFAYDRVKFPAAPRGVLLQKADLGRASWQAMQAEAGADAAAVHVTTVDAALTLKVTATSPTSPSDG